MEYFFTRSISSAQQPHVARGYCSDSAVFGHSAGEKELRGENPIPDDLNGTSLRPFLIITII